ERFAVADDHALHRIVRQPGADPGVHAHSRQADLVLRAFLVLVRVWRHPLLMGAPAQLGGRLAFLAKSLDAPGIDELVDLLGLVRDLSIALRAVNHLHAERLREEVELLCPNELGDVGGFPRGQHLVRDQAVADVEESLFRKVRDQAGVRAVLENRRRALRLPLRDQAANVHVPPVERLLGGVLLRAGGVWVPQLGRRVHVEHTVAVTPVEDLARIDVPREIDDDVARPDVRAEERSHVLHRDAVADEPDALRGPLLQFLRTVLEIHHRDVFGRDLKVFEQDRQRAFGHGAVADEEDLVLESGHLISEDERQWVRRTGEYGRADRARGELNHRSGNSPENGYD